MLRLIIALAITSMIWNQGSKLLSHRSADFGNNVVQSVKTKLVDNTPKVADVIETITNKVEEQKAEPLKRVIEKKHAKDYKKYVAQNEPVTNPAQMQNITAYAGYNDYYTDAEPIK